MGELLLTEPPGSAKLDPAGCLVPLRYIKGGPRNGPSREECPPPSLRFTNYKLFARFHINHDGDLEVYTLEVDKVPKEWKLDPKWDSELRQPQQMSHRRKHPSKWRATAVHQDPLATIRIVDEFVIKRT
ncbi:hypothetical protein Droror1_Dr00027408 [Drosera rotundifolia]